MNYNLSPLAKQNADIVPIEEVKVLHYHNSLYREALPWAMGYVERLPQDRAELIRKYVPFTANATLFARLHKKLLKTARQQRVERFREHAVLY